MSVHENRHPQVVRYSDDIRQSICVVVYDGSCVVVYDGSCVVVYDGSCVVVYDGSCVSFLIHIQTDAASSRGDMSGFIMM